jgi:hypothetical protein
MFKRSHATLLTLPLALLFFGTTAAAQTLPLVRYQGKGGAGVYAAAPAHRKVYESNPSLWDVFGTVGHCQATKQPGTMPLLNLMRPTKFGGEHFYTTDVNEAITVQNSSAVWVADDLGKVVCFVATSKMAGTIAVYRYRQPNGRSYIYAFGEAENNLLKQKADLKFERVAFYVWAQAGGGPTQHNFPDPSPRQSNFPDPTPLRTARHRQRTLDLRAAQRPDLRQRRQHRLLRGGRNEQERRPPRQAEDGREQDHG